MSNSRLPIFLWILLGLVLISILVAGILDRVGRPSPAMQATTVQAIKPLSSSPSQNPDIFVGNKVGDTAPDFTLQTTEGKEISLSDYRGKNVILNFWATWCGPCRFETSTIEAIHEAWADKDVVVLGINVQDSFGSASSYAKANNLKFTIPVDMPGDTTHLYGIYGIPTTFFINRDGKITAIKVGPFLNADEVQDMMTSFK